MVKCFFCNGGLKNWDHNDDPFQDHVRWFPKCQFIKQLMGADYVEKIREKYKNMDSGFTNEYGTGSNSQLKDSTSHYNNPAGGSTMNAASSRNSGAITSTNGRAKRPVSPRTLNSRLDTYIVRKITDANLISRESIKASIEKKLITPTSTPSSGTSSNSSSVTLSRTSQASVATNTPYSDDFKTPFDMAQMAYNFDKVKQDTADMFKSISDLMICFLPNVISVCCVKEVFQIKYGIYPASVR